MKYILSILILGIKIPSDSYYNWYGVLGWMNTHKPKKIDKYLPLLPPTDPSLNTRIKYEDGIFMATAVGDVEATNLINYLGLNKPELYRDRKKHIERIENLKKELCQNDMDKFLKELLKDPDNLSFASALEIEFGLNIEELHQLLSRSSR